MSGAKDSGKCVICDGKKINMRHTCTYCNGTGEWNQTAENYYNNHICQCIVWGRKFCPICKKECHHDSSLNPKQRIVPGYGGMSSQMRNPEVQKEEEEMILA